MEGVSRPSGKSFRSSCVPNPEAQSDPGQKCVPSPSLFHFVAPISLLSPSSLNPIEVYVMMAKTRLMCVCVATFAQTYICQQQLWLKTCLSLASRHFGKPWMPTVIVCRRAHLPWMPMVVRRAPESGRRPNARFAHGDGRTSMTPKQTQTVYLMLRRIVATQPVREF